MARNLFMPAVGRRGLDLTRLYELSEPLEAAIISSFYIVRETAGWQLPHSQVIVEALTANTLTRTRRIAAIAPFEVRIFSTFHIIGSFFD